jgi:hypothetical protein
METDKENWRQFHGTELGSVLSSIYGNKSKINYPQVKSKKSTPLQQGAFIGGKPNSSNPRESKINRKPAVSQPYVKPKSKPSVAPVDLIYHRKPQNIIQNEIEDIRMRNNFYRPAHAKAITSEEEKERLSQICTYKGGKGLPLVGTLPVGEAPFEVMERNRQKRLEENHRAKRLGVPVQAANKLTVLSYEEQLADQIVNEINERRTYLEEMERNGIYSDRADTIRNEIAIRLNELKKLNI